MSFILQLVKDTFVPVPPKTLPNEYCLNAQAETFSATGFSKNAKPNDHSSLEEVDLSTDNENIDIEKHIDLNEKKAASKYSDSLQSNAPAGSVEYYEYEEGRTHRKLKRRQIELIAIGGTIGVSLFVNIGTSLQTGGCLSLLLGFTLWCIPILEITCCCAEMVCYLPIKGAPFCTFAERFVDEAFGVMASWNFWVLECALIPFELTLFTTLIRYWTDDFSPALPLAVELAAYLFINIAAVRWYGEAEFWLCIGKVLLAVGLMLFTFITMVGGNPHHHAFGFTNWKNTPVMLEYFHTGALGKFQGFLGCLISASYMIAGPEYLSMAAGETINPRKVLPGAFRGVFFRLTTFFVGGALCVGILISSRDPLLINAIATGETGSGASPYTIAMHNMGIKILPSVLNAALLTSCFSAGNSYTFCSSRTLYGLAVDGRAPKIFSYCNKQGVPIFAVLVSLCWGGLGFLQMNDNANTVLNWIINLITASQLINYAVILFTYLKFRKAVIAQNIDISKFTFKSWWQPWACTVTFVVVFIMVWLQGYTVFLKGNWSVSTFLFSYLMCFIDIGIFIGWKLFKKTKYKSDPLEIDLITGLAEVEFHESVLEHQKLVSKKRNSIQRWMDIVTEFLFGKD